MQFQCIAHQKETLCEQQYLVKFEIEIKTFKNDSKNNTCYQNYTQNCERQVKRQYVFIKIIT